MKTRGSIRVLAYLLICCLSMSLIPVFPDSKTYAQTQLAAAETTAEPGFIVPVVSLTEVPAGYIGIYTKADLNNIRDNLSGKYILMNDIVFTQADFSTEGDYYNEGKGWAPVGKINYPFTGVLDGNGFRIDGLFIMQKGVASGQFALIAQNSGTVKNLKITNVHFEVTEATGGISVAAIAAINHNSGRIDNCISTGAISAESTGTSCVAGGIVGLSVGGVNDCGNYSDITSSEYAGGISGRNHDEGEGAGVVSGSYNIGNVSGDFYAGGITGYGDGDNTDRFSVSDSFNKGDVCSSTTGGWRSVYIGGIIGYSNKQSVIRCFNAGSVYSKKDSQGISNATVLAGGIAGAGNSVIRDCYNIGSIQNVSQGEGTAAAGIACGGLDFIAVYNAGRVSDLNNRCYPIVSTQSTPRTISGAYYNSGLGPYPTGSKGTPLTSTQMQNSSSYPVFSFGSTWLMNTATKLPMLVANPQGVITTIAFDQDSLLISKSGSKKLNVGFMPINACGEFAYKSGNNTIATVDTSGVVHAVNYGLTSITVTDKYSGKSAVCIVNVVQGISTLRITGDSSIEVAESVNLTSQIEPADAVYTDIAWSSSNPKVATVDSMGNVTGVSGGIATIYASAIVGLAEAEKVPFIMTVIRHPSDVVLSSESETIAVGEGIQITATVLPGDTSDKRVIWSTTDSNIASVNQEGQVTAISRGIATITATTVDGAVEASCEVECMQRVEAAWIHYQGLPVAEYTMQQGGSLQLTSIVEPDNANNQSVTWYNSNPSVITVDGTGFVQANAEGVAIVTLVTDEGGRTDTCVIFVGAAQTGSLAIDSTALRDGEPVEYTQTELTVPALATFLSAQRVSLGYALVEPLPAALSKPQWSTSDPAIATVDKFGYVHVIGAGPITITAYATDSGRITSSKEVTIIRDYSITYVLNGGINASGAPATYAYATGCTLLKPARTGYTFGGWYEDTAFAGAPVTMISATDKGDKVLYAKWIPNTYTIKFNDNGITTGSMASLPMTYNVAKNLTANAFKKTGYSFLGWAKTSTGPVAYKDKASVKNLTATNKATVNLYAKWGAPITSAASYNYNSIKVSWAYAGGATSYKIYRATSSTGTYSLVKTATSTSRYWIDTGRVTGKTYYYKVYPVAGGTTYKFSTYKYAKAIPSTPTATLSKSSSTSIKVSWTGIAGATKYQIYRATSSTGTYSLVYTASSTARYWVNTGRTPGKTYYYKVRAYHLEGMTNVYGGYSAVKYLKL